MISMEESKFAPNNGVSLKIGGISVKFPVKPYPSQLSMMSMIIRGLEKKQHCLLESPTGSGKSLALLCSAIAWQQVQQEKSENDFMDKLTSDKKNDKPVCTCDKIQNAEVTSASTSKYFDDQATSSTTVIDLCTPEYDDDFKATTTKSKGVKTENSGTCPACSCNAEGNGKLGKNVEEKEIKKVRVPKIWFGTRTHKQIAQITKELGRTSYDTSKMTILSSRQHSCIHPAVMKSSNKNEECRDLRKGTHALGAKCAFYQNVHRMKNHYQLSCAGMGAAWDLEELVGLGKNIKACPYYSAKELVSSANIIFCPYNYLIDPMIRTQMQINLSNQIIILDEAHNIEDSAREAGSYTMTEDALANTTSDLEYLINDDVKVEEHRPLHLLCMRLGQWVKEHSRNLNTSEYETASQVWYGRDIITHLTEWGITQDTLPLLEANFSEATDLGEEDVETAKILHSSSQATLGGLFNVLRYLMTEEYKYCDDYRVTIIRGTSYGPVPPKRTRDGWVTLHKQSKKHFVTNLHFWCLNPAVAFNDLSTAHCIILTSGTLSPMSSFSSELGLSFPIQLEANHVIKDSQVWVGSIGRGPGGIKLEATYKNTDKFEFQDELGNLVDAVCCTVPHGILCFFSSYSMLKKLQDRWQATGLWYKIEERKSIICEPRSSSKDEFDSLLQSFYDAVKESENGDRRAGALLLAVCRGKVSEGLDFADNNARAVITVGIPFPSIKDKQVELKRKYNDIHKSKRGLLSGAQWYEIQAYRAMNQALGRCIRHKTDWGALIIVDERFCKNPQKYSKGLSKWVRQKMRPYPSYESGMSNIAAFVQRQMFHSESCSIIENMDPQLDCLVTPSVPEKELSTNLPEFPSETCIKTTKKPQILFNKDTFPIKEKATKISTQKLMQTPINCKKGAELSSDEDFQTSISKTPKSTMKSKKRDVNHNETIDLVGKINSIESDCPSFSEAGCNNSQPIINEMLECTIPATPEKSNITIIPESPTSGNEEKVDITEHSNFIRQAIDFDDVMTTARKRKSVQDDDKRTPAKRTGGRKKLRSVKNNSKISCNRELEKKGKEESSFEQNSGELLTRTKRRQRNTKAKEKYEVESTLCCMNCLNVLHKTTKVLNCEQIQSVYISDRFHKTISAKYKQNSSCFVYPVDVEAIISGSVKLITENNNGGELNSVWCRHESKCYQMYECSSCSSPIAFQIVSDSITKYLFWPEWVTKLMQK